ncbi:hypothetical protein ACIBP6_09460 [Nonomuraea terrae]|uniref:hypothetical protein n=1 Tax=Nonomuraea terrae TaxID=2530383 RepID=UPI0037B338B0
MSSYARTGSARSASGTSVGGQAPAPQDVDRAHDRDLRGAWCVVSGLFRGFVAEWLGRLPDAGLRAELVVASVVSTHNEVPRAGGAHDPSEPLDHALGYVIATFRHLERPQENWGQVVVATFSQAVMAAVRQHLDSRPSS